MELISQIDFFGRLRTANIDAIKCRVQGMWYLFAVFIGCEMINKHNHKRKGLVWWLWMVAAQVGNYYFLTM